MEKSAGCYGGKSLFVEFGRDDCVPENGISSGSFSEWVRSRYLVTDRPDKPVPRASELPGEG